jgi:hypothetical protein
MAKMRLTSTAGRYSVTVTGHLAAQDLRRLERLCGPALEQPTAPLTLRLKSVTSVDDPARTYLNRLVQRGAVLVVD